MSWTRPSNARVVEGKPADVPPSRVEGAEGRSGRLAGLAFRFPVRYRVVWLAVALLLLVCVVDSPATLSGTSLESITALGGVLVIASLGQLLVIMLGGIDLSVPAIMTVAAAILVRGTDGQNGKLLEFIVIALVVCALLGLINGLLVSHVKLNALIVTLATNTTILGAVNYWTGTSFSNTREAPPSLIHFTKQGVGWFSLLALIALALTVAIALALKRTRLGRNFVAAGANGRAAEVLGIRVSAHRASAYMLGGLLYGIAGILLAGFVKYSDIGIGSPYQLETVVAVALGGAALAGGPSSAAGTVAGAFFLVLLSTYLAVKGVSGGTVDVMQGAILVIAVAMVTSLNRGRGGLKVPKWLHLRQRD